MKGGAAAVALSVDLARELGQLPERTGPSVVRVPSRKTAGVFYDVVIGLDGALQCNCPASFNRLMCWHVRYVREEMDMTTEVSKALVPVVVQPSVALLPSEREMNMIDRAAAMVWAGAVSIPKELNSQAKVAAVMLYGLELGLRPMTAIQHLYIVEGKVAASAQVMAGMCMSKEPDIRILVQELTDEMCTMRFVRPSRGVDASMTITWEQIKKAGLARGANLQYPEDRLRYHCTKRLCRTYAPDLINNLDEGVPVAGVSEAPQWRVDESDLYNEGDAPQLSAPQHEATQQGPVSASAGAGSEPPVSPPAAPSPTYDWRAFAADLKDKGVTSEDVVRVVTPAKGSVTVGEFARWVQEHDATPEQLAQAILTAKQGACEHDAGQYDEALTIMRCSKCGLQLDGPPVEEHAEALPI